MKNDKIIYEKMKDLKVICTNWTNYVDALNQCAYTNRGVEQAIKTVKQLEVVYKENNLNSLDLKKVKKLSIQQFLSMMGITVEKDALPLVKTSKDIETCMNVPTILGVTKISKAAFLAAAVEEFKYFNGNYEVKFDLSESLTGQYWNYLESDLRLQNNFDRSVDELVFVRGLSDPERGYFDKPEVE